MRGRYQTLKDKVDKRVEEFRNLNEMGNDKLLSSEGSSVQELGRRFTYLNARWTDVTDRIYERYRHLQNASHEYGEFRALVAQESDWLDKLDKRLKKSPKAAADAEEISEELDVSIENSSPPRRNIVKYFVTTLFKKKKMSTLFVYLRIWRITYVIIRNLDSRRFKRSASNLSTVTS